MSITLDSIFVQVAVLSIIKAFSICEVDTSGYVISLYILQPRLNNMAEIFLYQLYANQCTLLPWKN